MVNGGATHNFIDAPLVIKRKIHIEYFKGFDVVVAYGYKMMCTQRVKVLELTLGNYKLTDEFYIMDLADTHVVLGV